MAETNSRIEQFRKMASDDPKNEVAHFSLGREYLAAGDYESSLASLDRCLALNPNISKAYQLQAQALLHLGRNDQAIAKLTEGVQRRFPRRNDAAERDDANAQGPGWPGPEFKSAAVAPRRWAKARFFVPAATARLRSFPSRPSRAQKVRKFRKNLATVARMDSDGHKGDQRTSPAAE